jgi:protein TonB
MDSKKILLWPVLISIIGHVVMISVSGMIDLRDNVRTAEIFTVDIQEPEPQQPPKKEEEKKEVKKSEQAKNEKAINTGGWREDTVDLTSGDVKYGAYLGKIKKRILQIWQYPKKAYDRNEEGVVVVKMSIDADGSVAQAALIASSGSMLLDEGALGVVRAAAPFAPLPESYSLSRLNITASFRYKLVE